MSPKFAYIFAQFLLLSAIGMGPSSARSVHQQHINEEQATEFALMQGDLLVKLSPATREASNDAEICPFQSDKNATLLQTIRKSTGLPVKLGDSPFGQFSVSFCQNAAEDQPDECAVGAHCSTIYRWTQSLVQSEADPSEFEADAVLIPIACSCTLNWRAISTQGPLILEN